MQEMKLKSNGYGMLIGWTVWLIIVFVVMEVLNLVASRSPKTSNPERYEVPANHKVTKLLG